MEEIQKLKEFIFPNGSYSNIRSSSKLIKIYFPLIYKSIKENYKTNLYMLLHNINNIPICNNPECKKEVKLKNISEGFRRYCSNSCIGKHQKINKNFALKISQSLSKNGKIHLKEKYPNTDISYIDSNNILIRNYCKHGNIKLSIGVFNKLYKNNKNLCYTCSEEIFKNFIPTLDELQEFQHSFNEFYYKHSLAMKEKWFIMYYPKEYKMILEWSNHIKYISFPERAYMFKYALKNKPICAICSIREVKFSKSQGSYNKICDSYACKKNTSIQELEVYEFIKSLDNDAKHKFYIGKREYDMLLPNSKLLIEYNGLYWHSDKIITDKHYHLDKKKLALDNNYDIFYIWEDEWLHKRNIIESMIKSRANCSDIKIHARKTHIVELSSRQNKDFFDKNHLQGSTAASIKLGLYYEGELVSAMTFGKNRKVLGGVSANSEYELLRFANKLNTNVIGGASKLFNFFICQYEPKKIISYANYDISNGNLYIKLGFRFIRHTGVNFWWVNHKKRYPRYDFMKYKLVQRGEDPLKTAEGIMREKGYFKIWGSGNLKYEWNN